VQTKKKTSSVKEEKKKTSAIWKRKGCLLPIADGGRKRFGPPPKIVLHPRKKKKLVRAKKGGKHSQSKDTGSKGEKKGIKIKKRYDQEKKSARTREKGSLKEAGKGEEELATEAAAV